MNDKLSGLNKGLAAIGALVWPFARVDAHVPVQFAAVFESPAAVWAPVRLFFRVNSPVNA